MEDKKEEHNTPEKKSESPEKIKTEKETLDSINKINLTEQVQNNSKRKSFILGKITKEFKEEDEEKEINIKYKEHGNKIMAMSLDLLLKKITTENFVNENPIKTYSFCQQCFCFIDKDILFNKIFNCYDYYKKKKVGIVQICNLIKFLDILVIEMYEYYTSLLKLNDPILITLDNFYQLLMTEIFELINKKEKEEEEKKNSNPDFISKEFENSIENKIDFNNNLTNNNKEELIKDRCCVYIPDNFDNTTKVRERFNTIHNLNKDKKTILKTEPNSNNISSNKKSSNLLSSKEIPRQTMNKQKVQLGGNKKETKFKNNNITEKEEKNGFTNIFFNIKKEKPITIRNKNEKEPEKKVQPKINRVNAFKKETSTPEAEILSEITNIKVFFSFEPKKRDLEQAKKKLYFYKDLKKKIWEAIGKTIKESEPPKSRHAMMKSVTVGNLGKKNKLKLHNNDGFFDVLDWDKNEIGEKLISTSKNLINKVQRREIYKAIFLKNKKYETSPNVMENIDKFNRLTFFIIQDILSYDFAKDRAKIVEKWVKIADYCRERKDYNDCVAINSALNNYIITGLNKTMNEISKDKKELMKSISRFCRYQGNYKKLREDMDKLDNNEFYIPYLGMLLKDLAFFEENSKYIINDILINFEKLENVQLAVCKFFNFQNAKDKINPIIPEELGFFDNLEDLKESDLEELANKLEPEFTLGANKKREKRITNIDKAYFMDTNVIRPNMKDSKKLSKK
jgi:hypothetical protein